MPKTDVVFYRDDDGTVPVLDWLKELRRRDRRVYAKCYVKIGLLQELGYDMRRPDADFLRSGIYELRVRFGRVNYRILYFFYREGAAVLSHSLVKEDKVPDRDVEMALARKAKFESEPERHTYYEETDDKRRG